MSAFYEGMAEILDLEPGEVGPDLALDDANWDSMAIVSAIALIDELYDETIGADALGECKTVGDIEALVERTRNKG